MADFIALSSVGGSLTGICPDCGSMMYRRVTAAKLASIRGELDVSVPKAHSRIGESTRPFVNSDL